MEDDRRSLIFEVKMIPYSHENTYHAHDRIIVECSCMYIIVDLPYWWFQPSMLRICVMNLYLCALHTNPFIERVFSSSDNRRERGTLQEFKPEFNKQFIVRSSWCNRGGVDGLRVGRLRIHDILDTLIWEPSPIIHLCPKVSKD
ncbi:hypothetical protein MTR_0007s0320 [Medicago truncatula]|uniref:Uncharacterized protein n=1 Tax=Medicago truncatula TaxID=3880 RepID=A0A072TVM8_MEDTR|nr:hypothetical protein MTR_0007s0320 [Medicago truncatula]